MSYKFTKRVSYVLIIFPVVVFFIYSFLGLDISDGFFERNGLAIKIVLLTLSIISSFILIYFTSINRDISKSSKKFIVAMCLSWIVFLMMVIYLIYAFRNCCGF